MRHSYSAQLWTLREVYRDTRDMSWGCRWEESPMGHGSGWCPKVPAVMGVREADREMEEEGHSQMEWETRAHRHEEHSRRCREL